MPIYEYRCKQCEREFEKYVPGAATAVACPACASEQVMRKLSVFGLKTAGALRLGYARRMLALSREARQALDQFQGRLRPARRRRLHDSRRVLAARPDRSVQGEVPGDLDLAADRR